MEQPPAANGDAPKEIDILGLVPPKIDDPPAAPRKSRKWLWFFVALAVLAALAIGINLAWNLGEPLTPEKLQAARTKWTMNRPMNYDLKILTVLANGGVKNLYDLKVRGGRIVEFKVNGRDPEPVLDAEGRRRPESEHRQREQYDIDGLFDTIEDLMALDRKEGRKAYTRGRFDKNDGHLTLFQRQYQGRQEQLIQVELTQVPAEPKP